MSQSSLSFVLDSNLGLQTDTEPWKAVLAKAGIQAEPTDDLVHIDKLLENRGPDLAYVPGADFCRMLIKGDQHYQGIVIATSKFTRQPWQRSLLVVKKDDPANHIQDLEGASYAFMNNSCSSSYFPPAILLNQLGKNLKTFLKCEQIHGWQPRVDAVISGKVRATMILDDIWKLNPRMRTNAR